jgi:hypothetical protein
MGMHHSWILDRGHIVLLRVRQCAPASSKKGPCPAFPSPLFSMKGLTLVVLSYYGGQLQELEQLEP